MAAATLTAAPSAAAATQNLSVDCTATVPVGAPLVVDVRPGDTLSFTSSTTACNFAATFVPTYAAWFASYTNDGFGGAATEPLVWVISDTAPLGVTGANICFGVGSTCTYFVALNVIAGQAMAESDQTPPSILQSVRTSASGRCDVIDDVPFSYGTGVKGGWSQSWAEWANGGQGGDVCVRTLVYSNSIGGWTVQP